MRPRPAAGGGRRGGRARLPAPRALLLLAVLLGPAGPSATAAQEDAPPAPAAPGAETAGDGIPRPELGAMEDAPRRRIEALQAALERLQADPAASDAELAEAFGELGRHFQAFELADAAEEAYERAHELSPDDVRWTYFLALVQHAEGDLETAVGNYRASLSDPRNRLPTLIHLGDALLALDRVDEAEDAYRRALELDPESAAAHYGLGRAAASADRPAEAVERFERVLALQPDASVVHYLLGQAYRKTGDLERARRELALRGDRAVVFPDPLGAEVTRLAKGTAFQTVLEMARAAERVPDEEFLGFVLSQFGDVEGTIEELRRGIDAQAAGDEAPPLEVARVRYVLAGLLVDAGRDDEAIAELRRALELAPGLIDARIKLGNALARSGDYEAAVAAFDEVLARAPHDRSALLKRAAAQSELERWAEARADLERLVAADPSSSEAQVRLAAVLEELGEPAAAEARYREAAGLDLSLRERVTVHARLAALLAQRGAAEDALAEYARALEADGTAVPALRGQAMLLGRLGRFAEAADAFATLVEVVPDEVAPRLAEVTALILAGRHGEARERLEAGLLRFPESLDLKDVLARHLAASPDRSVRDGERALELAEEVFAAVPTPESVETLAMAHAEAGRFAEAVRWQSELIERLGEDGGELPPGALERLRANLALYERGEPCCAG